MIRLDRRVMELRGTPAADVTLRMRDQIRLHSDYLGEGRSPADLGRTDSSMAHAWSATLGTSPGDQYGRPFRFHQEAQAANWEGAWERVSAPVLVVRGANDFLMSEEEHRRIVAIVNRKGVARGTFRTIPGLDHNFAVTRSMAESLQGKVGGSNLLAPDLFIAWMRGR
jgi:pimeloyl-ACP methyl ester carboxylesterase